MKITLKDIKEKLDQLINEELPRETISNWAIERQEAHDNEVLEFIPINEKTRIWRALSYLTGVDLLDMDGS
jgi:hypothetical protein